MYFILPLWENRFKFKTVTTGEFRDLFVSVMTQKFTPEESTTPKKNKKNKNKSNDNAAQNEANAKILASINALDWDHLFLSRGFPTYPIEFKNSLSLTCKILARHWWNIAKDTPSPKFSPEKKDIQGWSSQQICLFLDTLLDYSQQTPFSVEVLEKLNAAYGFNDSKNAEICLRWQSLGLKANAPWIVPQVIEFITSQGRMKFVRPLYRLFRQSQVGGHLANEVFQKNKNM